MKRMFIAIIMLACAGCVPTSQQIQGLGNDVDTLMATVDNYQDKVLATVDNYQEKITEEIDRVQEHIKIVNEAVKNAEGPVEAIGAGIEASKPFNPYADEMSAVLALGVAAASLFAKKKSNDAAILKKKYQAHKTAVEGFRIANPDKAAELFKNVGEARAKLI